jgi:hypothetical protein
MSVRPNPDLAIAEWLREEADAGAPERLLLAIRRQLESTNQRRAWWPARRFQSMNTTARFLSAAAAVAVVAVIAVLALPRVGGQGAKPTFPPSMVPLMEGASPAGDLPPGTYLIGDPFPVRAAITVPAGWTPYTVDPQNAGILVNHAKPPDGSGWGLFFLAGPHFYKDPCHPESGTVDAAAVSTAANVVATLTSLPSVTASTPVAITVDGRPATLVTLTAAADTATCRDAGATLWQTLDGTDYTASPGQAIPLRVVDVDGQPIVIMATDFPETSHWENQVAGATPNATAHAADQIELRQIVDSIRIEGRTPASPGPTPSPGPTAAQP